jgi:hypothetical protein
MLRMSTILLALGGLLLGCDVDAVDPIGDDLTFEEWTEEYFAARADDDIDDVCADWYDACVDAGHSEEDCASRIEYCDGWVWGEEGDDEDREEGDDEEREEGDDEEREEGDEDEREE